MRLTRCYAALPLQAGARVVLPELVANHLARVLRLREGDACVLFNGDGQDHDGRIASIGKREVVVELQASRAVDNESPLHVTLLQGIARGERLNSVSQLSKHPLRCYRGRRLKFPTGRQRGQMREPAWGMAPEKFSAFLENDRKQWADIVKAANISLEQ